MGKEQTLPTCEYCGAPCKSFSGIESHIAQKPACAARRFLSRNPAPNKPRPKPNPSTPVRARSPSVTLEEVEDEDVYRNRLRDSPRRNPNAILEEADDVPVRARSPSVRLEEVEDEDVYRRRFWDSPRRNPNAILEEIDDDDIFGPFPPRRSPSVTLDEMEDEVMPERPRWGPHPFAKPTRPSLFPDPHPDPTAGVATEFYEVDREAPPKYTSVLAEPDVFREAYWLDHLPITFADEAAYFALPRTRNWFCSNLKEFEQEVNKLPRGPNWYRETIIVHGDQDNEVLDLWKRDIADLIRFLLSDPRFIRHTRYAPERHYSSKKRRKRDRVYGQMWSGRWWWQMQNILGPYSTIVPIILSTDKTKLTVFSGNQKAWPVERATLLVGFIPVSNLSNISNPKERSEAGWQLFHTCMESILEPLKTLSQTGMDVLCADGGVRRVFPILASFIADFPEQALVTCVRESCCPVCWIPAKDRGDLMLRYPLRDRRRTCDALEDNWNGYTRTIKTLGIRPTQPFWAELPYVDISTCMTPDLLHQLDKGVFGDHLITWTKVLLTSNEMDRRTKGMPRFQKLRHFAKGISVISSWTGKEAKALGNTFMSIVAGDNRPMLVKAAKSIIDFTFRAHRPEISEADLDAMDQDLLEFNRAKSVFVGKKKYLVQDEQSWKRIAKIHMLTHYSYLIRQLGAPEGFNTEITERLHIEYVKKPWSTTNHVNATQQMVSYLQSREAWALLRAYMHETGLVIDERFRDRDRKHDDGDDGDDGPEDVVGGDDGSGDGGEVWEPNPSVAIAKRPSLGTSVTGAYLITKHNAIDFVPATIDYLRSVVPAGAAIPISHNTIFQVWRRFKLHHRRLPFYPVLDPQTDQVRAFTTSSDSEGRVLRGGYFDVVLFSTGDADIDQQGLQRLEAGRVRAIFALPTHHQSLCSKKLAYIERFRPFTARPSATTSLYRTEHALDNRRRRAIVVPLSQIRMTCHLAPRYHLLDENTPVSSSTDLLSIHDAFYLNKYASRWLFSVFDYWEGKL
ncbi:hypothetical protein FRC12_023710 [Ceratobasidium sp. 428]|nr:hypothetical protein FRC12_023710 [Ceratobasidium sp. 428]